ncbi:MAG: NAD(P)H-quinone oxidoreductase [Pseudomonadota bacterium]
MRAIEIRQPGPPEGLALTQRPVPELKAGEVLVKVAAAGVNRPDVLQRQGKYPPPPGASDLPGLEIAGTVAKAAEGVSRWKAGDAVCALLTGGGYAEYVAVPADQCLPVPKGLSLAQAASLPETFFTVWHNVFERGRLAQGESFLIQGGTSGIGVTAIQMVKAFGHRVFATAGSDDKCAACVRLGADRAINYRTEDFVEAVQQETGGKGVDVILDMVGGDYIPRELKALAADGRLVLIAFLGGAKATVNFADVMLRRLTITGSTLRARPVAVKAGIARALEQNVWPLVESGKIKPVVHATFPLAHAADAHALMESSAHIGKIVLEI